MRKTTLNILLNPEPIKLGKASSKKQREKISKDFLHFLWATWIKATAGFMSEYSKRTEDLCAHHLAGKGNLSLRYFTLENGMCLTRDEHGFMAHGNQSAKTRFNEWVKMVRGEDFFSRCLMIKHKEQHIPPVVIQEFLLEKIAPFVSEITDYYELKEYKDVKTINKYKKMFKLLVK